MHGTSSNMALSLLSKSSCTTAKTWSNDEKNSETEVILSKLKL
jgi:hypothetical protein